MRMMTLMLALFAVLLWFPQLFARPQAHFNWSECVLTFLTTGAAWMVAELRSLCFSRKLMDDCIKAAIGSSQRLYLARRRTQ